jgi:hypothetical protein
MKITFEQYEKLLENIDGVSEKELERIDEKSSYNHNFYYFIKDGIHYILLGESDDNEETEWWWCVGDTLLLIGYSYVENHIIKPLKRIYT